MTNVTDWLTVNKLSVNISKTKYMLNTNNNVITDSFEIVINGNRIERTLSYNHIGLAVD